MSDSSKEFPKNTIKAFKVTLTEAYLKVKLYFCGFSLNPSAYHTLQAKCKAVGQMARYTLVHSKIRMFALDGETTRLEKDDMFVGQIPDRMIVGLLNNRAFIRDLKHYPFSFQKFLLTQIRQVIDSEAYPCEALKLNGGDQLKY